MNWKKVFSLILVLTIILIAPLNSTFAEEKDEKKEENPDEIIKHEDEDNAANEDIPDPPKDESLIGDEEDVHEVEIETPSSVTGEKAEGSGTVVDFSTTGARAFYTIVDDDDNTFYLMIDMDKADNNVYFLSDVNGEQISSDSGKTKSEDTTGLLGSGDSEDETNNDSEQTQKVDSKEQEEKEESSSNLGFLIAVVSIGLIGAFGYYFFVIKKKQNENLSEETSEDEDDDLLEIYEDDDLFTEETSEDQQEINEDEDK